MKISEMQAALGFGFNPASVSYPNKDIKIYYTVKGIKCKSVYVINKLLHMLVISLFTIIEYVNVRIFDPKNKNLLHNADCSFTSIYNV